MKIHKIFYNTTTFNVRYRCFVLQSEVFIRTDFRFLISVQTATLIRKTSNINGDDGSYQATYGTYLLTSETGSQ